MSLAIVVVGKENFSDDPIECQNNGTPTPEEVELYDDYLPSPLIPVTEENCGNINVKINGKSKRAEVSLRVKILTPHLIDDGDHRTQLIELLESLCGNSDYDRPIHYPPTHLYSRNVYLVISDISFQPDNQNYLYGYFKVRNTPQDCQELGKLLSEIAEDHWPEIWPQLRLENIKGGRHHNMETYLKGLYPFLPGTANMFLNDDGIFVRK